MGHLQAGDHAATVERTTVVGVDGAAVQNIHAWPDSTPTTGVVVCTDIMGLYSIFDEMAERLATHGFAVMTPEPFARAPHEVTTIGEVWDPLPRQLWVGQWDESVQLGDVLASADALVERHGVERVVVIGFCLGGMMAFNAAATGRFDRAVAMYGSIIVRDHWKDLSQPIDRAAEMCPTLAIFAADDTMITPQDAEALRQAWAGRDDCEVVVYPGVKHAFVHAVGYPPHDEAAAADAWARALAFVGES